MLAMSDKESVRWWASVVPSEGCWHWVGHMNQKGYGRMWLHGRLESAHRVSFFMHKGDVPDGMEVDHVCNNRSCVNPEHLRAVAHKDNVLRGESFSAVFARRTVCDRCGLALSGDNVRIRNERGFKSRRCVNCLRSYGREKMRQYRAAKRAKVWSLERSQEG